MNVASVESNRYAAVASDGFTAPIRLRSDFTKDIPPKKRDKVLTIWGSCSRKAELVSVSNNPEDPHMTWFPSFLPTSSLEARPLSSVLLGGAELAVGLREN